MSDPSIARDPDPDQAQVLLEVIAALAAELAPGGRRPRVDLDSDLETDLGIDSLGRTELLLRIENRFGRSLTDAVAVRARTPRELLAALEAGRRQRGPTAPRPTAAAPSQLDSEPHEAATLVEALERHASLHPQRTHVCVYPDEGEVQELSYGELLADARRVAGALLQRGCGHGDTIALMLPTGADFFRAFAGVLMAGCVPVPLYPPFRMDQIEEHLRREVGILDNAAARYLISFPEARALGRYLRSRLPGLQAVLTLAELSVEGPEFVLPRPGAEDLALIQYTSGSTGEPKGVTLSHANLLANVRAMGVTVGASADDVFVSWLPLYHDMGLIGAWLGSLYYGMRLVVMSPLAFVARPYRWLWLIHEHGGTISGAPNFAYELCARRVEDGPLQGLDLSSWRLAFNGAEPVNPDTLQRFIERYGAHGFSPAALTPVYGLAECAVGLAFSSLDRPPRIDRIQRARLEADGRAEPAAEEDARALRFAACGRPLPGHEIRIVNEIGQEVGEREVGQLQFRGPSATAGYFRNPEASRRIFDQGWLNSGDYAYIAEGEVFITGRAKDMIIRAGRNIYPQELEGAVGDIAGIRRGCVVAFGTGGADGGGERLVLVAETRKAEDAAREKLRSRINQASFALLGTAPDDVLLVPPHSIPKTSSGKLRRSASRELYLAGRLGQRRAVWWQLLRLAAGNTLPLLRNGRRLASDLAYAGYCHLLFALIAPVGTLLILAAPNRRLARRIARGGARLLLWLTRTPLQVSGLEHLPAEGAHVIAANHGSYLDGLVLTAVLPPDYAFVAKRELTDKLIPRLALGALGAFFVERFDAGGGIEDAARTAEAVADGQSLVFFPEGTFTRQPGLRAFRMGAFKIAAELGIPVVPVALRGTRSIIREVQYMPRRGRIRVAVLAPIAAAGPGWQDALALREATRAAILAQCGEPDLHD